MNVTASPTVAAPMTSIPFTVSNRLSAARTEVSSSMTSTVPQNSSPPKFDGGMDSLAPTTARPSGTSMEKPVPFPGVERTSTL